MHEHFEKMSAIELGSHLPSYLFEELFVPMGKNGWSLVWKSPGLGRGAYLLPDRRFNSVFEALAAILTGLRLRAMDQTNTLTARRVIDAACHYFNNHLSLIDKGEEKEPTTSKELRIALYNLPSNLRTCGFSVMLPQDTYLNSPEDLNLLRQPKAEGYSVSFEPL